MNNKAMGASMQSIRREKKFQLNWGMLDESDDYIPISPSRSAKQYWADKPSRSGTQEFSPPSKTNHRELWNATYPSRIEEDLTVWQVPTLTRRTRGSGMSPTRSHPEALPTPPTRPFPHQSTPHISPRAALGLGCADSPRRCSWAGSRCGSAAMTGRDALRSSDERSCAGTEPRRSSLCEDDETLSAADADADADADAQPVQNSDADPGSAEAGLPGDDSLSPAEPPPPGSAPVPPPGEVAAPPLLPRPSTGVAAARAPPPPTPRPASAYVSRPGTAASFRSLQSGAAAAPRPPPVEGRAGHGGPVILGQPPSPHRTPRLSSAFAGGRERRILAGGGDARPAGRSAAAAASADAGSPRRLPAAAGWDTAATAATAAASAIPLGAFLLHVDSAMVPRGMRSDPPHVVGAGRGAAGFGGVSGRAWPGGMRSSLVGAACLIEPPGLRPAAAWAGTLEEDDAPALPAGPAEWTERVVRLARARLSDLRRMLDDAAAADRAGEELECGGCGGRIGVGGLQLVLRLMGVYLTAAQIAAVLRSLGLATPAPAAHSPAAVAVSDLLASLLGHRPDAQALVRPPPAAATPAAGWVWHGSPPGPSRPGTAGTRTGRSARSVERFVLRNRCVPGRRDPAEVALHAG
jgi:hypothetical protein